MRWPNDLRKPSPPQPRRLLFLCAASSPSSAAGRPGRFQIMPASWGCSIRWPISSAGNDLVVTGRAARARSTMRSKTRTRCCAVCPVSRRCCNRPTCAPRWPVRPTTSRSRSPRSTRSSTRARSPNNSNESTRSLARVKDARWAIAKDRLRTAEAVADLLNGSTGRAAIEAFTSVQIALSALDRLEVRGRDSAGLHLLVRGHQLDLSVDRNQRAARPAGGRSPVPVRRGPHAGRHARLRLQGRGRDRRAR